MNINTSPDAVAALVAELDLANQAISLGNEDLEEVRKLLTAAQAREARLREALEEAYNELPREEFIEDHDAVAASTFRALTKTIRAALAQSQEVKP